MIGVEPAGYTADVIGLPPMVDPHARSRVLEDIQLAYISGDRKDLTDHKKEPATGALENYALLREIAPLLTGSLGGELIFSGGIRGLTADYALVFGPDENAVWDLRKKSKHIEDGAGEIVTDGDLLGMFGDGMSAAAQQFGRTPGKDLMNDITRLIGSESSTTVLLN
ncbi:MAG: hypothetical protein HYV38_01980 [Candidatus Levybacteria bacterium]|nr:hypothetical protein [Candidatus Levybacteria bacterium]